MEGPEIHHPHKPHTRHGRLPPWIELAIAITALVTSVSSIVIALHHGTIMEKLVQANSLPYMQGGFSDVTPEGAEVLSLDLLNRGVGPAHEQSLRVKSDGRYVTSVKELFATVLEPATLADVEERKLLRTLKNGVRTRFIPGGQQQFVFRLAKTPENAAYWDKLKEATSKWDIEYCYCSVFEECWQVLEKWTEPEPIDQCARDESREFMP